MSPHPRRFSGDYRPLSRIDAASSTVSLSDPTSGSTSSLAARAEVELRFRRLSTDVTSTQSKQVRSMDTHTQLCYYIFQE